MADPTYTPPEVWTNTESGGQFASINRPTAGAREERELPVGEHPFQLYSSATPNGVKASVMLEELLEAGHDAEYDAWYIGISDGDQFSSGFVDVNPNSKIPALVDRSGPEPVRVFESGAILLHLAEKDERLLPRDPQGRASTISWLFAAYNSVEPMMFELGNVDIFARGEEWAKLRRPSLMEFAGQRLDRLADALEGRDYLAGPFTIADIAMATVLREAVEAGLIAEQPRLQAYLDRCLARPAFQRAMDAQLAAFSEEAGPPA